MPIENSNSNLPPLISNSPPPFQGEETDTDDVQSPTIIKESNNLNDYFNLDTNDQDDEWDPFSSSTKTIEVQVQDTPQTQLETWADFNPAEGDDDEWADFVDTAIIPQKPQEPVLASSLNIPISKPHDLDLFGLIDKLFLKNDCKFGTLDDKKVEGLQIDSDCIWEELNTYTSETDASISLKFKWYLSNLEGNYLKSLNLERVVPNSNTSSHNNKKSKPNFLSNDILQPVKVESNQLVNNSTNLDNTSLDSVQFESDKDKENLKYESFSNNFDQTTINKTPVLDLDLSYFETNTKTSSKSDTNSKGYLDLLLQDIYANNKNANPGSTRSSNTNLSKKDDDNFFDKKSISSNSSNSSSNLNELSIQLQPHRLEQQQYLDQVHTNQSNDKEAIEFLSKLQNLSFINTKAMVFPLKQIVQAQQQDK